MGKQALIATLKPLLQDTLHKNSLVWEDVQPILETIDIVDELKAAAEDPATFLSRLSDLGGPAAFLLRHLVISGSGPSRCISFNIPSHTFAQKTDGSLVQKFET